MTRFTVTVNPDGNNTSVNDLAEDVQDALDKLLFGNGLNQTLVSTLGFGEVSLSFNGTTSYVASGTVPSSGQLGSDLRFMLKIDGGDPIFGYLRASDTENNAIPERPR